MTDAPHIEMRSLEDLRAWPEKIKRAKTDATREKLVATCADAVRRGLKDGGLR